MINTTNEINSLKTHHIELPKSKYVSKEINLLDEELKRLIYNLNQQQKDIDAEITKIVDNNFWDILA